MKPTEAPKRLWVLTGQIKDYKIGICCFSAKYAYASLRRKNKDWLARNQDNVSQWGDMSIHGLLFQWATCSTIKNQLSVLVYYKVDLVIISLMLNLFSVLHVAHWNNSLRVDMSPHSDTLSWFRANQSLFFLLSAVYTYLAKKQQMPIL
jgi:hypothetical protein